MYNTQMAINKVLDKASNFNLKATLIGENTIRLQDKNILMDDWIVVFDTAYMTLKHINKRSGKVDKMVYHLQRKYELDKWYIMLKYIHNHNKNSIGTKHNQHERIDRVLKKYNRKHAA